MKLKIPNSHFLKEALHIIDNNYEKLSVDLVTYETHIQSLAGGRDCNDSTLFDGISEYNNITIASLMSNYYIKDFQNNKSVLEMLDKINNINGEVIVAKPVYSKFIKKNFSNIKTTLSCTYFAFTNTSILDNLHLFGLADNVCILPDENRIIDKIPSEFIKNTEVVVNEFCVSNCKSRKDHYQAISDKARGKSTVFTCPHMGKIDKRDSYGPLTQDLHKLISQGIVNFKVGRRIPYDTILWVCKFIQDRDMQETLIQNVKKDSYY